MGWGLIGQERAVAALERSLAGPGVGRPVGPGRAAHAYVFVGPERVGKHTLALKLAQALNCEAAERSSDKLRAGPCGECNPCRRVAGGIHADVQTVTVEEGEEGTQKGIHVSQIREIERSTALKPFEGRNRVVIIDPAEEMNTAAQNAFLKTLEEPPPQVVFVLVTADESRLLPTIRSRCRRLELRLPSVADVEAALLERGVDGERARLLARLSRGRVGWALEMADDPSPLERRQESLSQARALASMSAAERLGLAERLAPDFKRKPAALLAELEAWRDWWRDVLLVQTGAGDGVTNVDRLPDLRRDATRCSRDAVAAFVRAVGDAARNLQENAQPRLVLETLLLGAPIESGQAARR